MQGQGFTILQSPRTHLCPGPGGRGCSGEPGAAGKATGEHCEAGVWSRQAEQGPPSRLPFLPSSPLSPPLSHGGLGIIREDAGMASMGTAWSEGASRAHPEPGHPWSPRTPAGWTWPSLALLRALALPRPPALWPCSPAPDLSHTGVHAHSARRHPQGDEGGTGDFPRQASFS